MRVELGGPSRQPAATTGNRGKLDSSWLDALCSRQAATKQSAKQKCPTRQELTGSDIETATDHCRLITMRSSGGQPTSKLRKQLKQPVLPLLSSLTFVTTLSCLLLCSLSFHLLVAFAQEQPASPPEGSQQIHQFVDPACKWNQEEPPTEAEKLLFVLKCDFQPLLGTFETLMASLEPEGPQRLQTAADVDQMRAVERSLESDRTRLDIVSFNSLIGSFYGDAMAAIKKKEFCSYSTVSRYKQLRAYTVNGSSIFTNLYELIAIEYHTLCLKLAVTKLPKIPQIVKEVVDIYIDGKDSSLPDLNRPAGFNDDKKDEFRFDLERAIERNGRLEDVVGLIMDFGLSSSASDQVSNFKQSCKRFLIEVEERWQTMELMSEMLSTEVNNIQSVNNFVLRALVPTKYADVCSQLSGAS